MATLKKSHWYRHIKKKRGVDVIPLEDREVPAHIYLQYVEVDKNDKENVQDK